MIMHSSFRVGKEGRGCSLIYRIYKVAQVDCKIYLCLVELHALLLSLYKIQVKLHYSRLVLLLSSSLEIEVDSDSSDKVNYLSYYLYR